MRKSQETGNPGPAALAKADSLHEFKQLAQQIMDEVRATKRGTYYGVQMHNGWTYPAEMMFLYEGIFPERVINVNTEETAKPVSLVLRTTNTNMFIAHGALTVVSARLLYENLGHDPTNFSRWCKRNLTNNAFAVENEDYVLLVQRTNEGAKGKFGDDYGLSVSFAKRLCMMAKSEKGEAVRKYFIQCEQSQRPPHKPSKTVEQELAEELEQLRAEKRIMESLHKTAMLEQGYEYEFNRPADGQHFKYRHVRAISA